MRIFHKASNKDIVKKIENVDEKLDLVHKSLARLRVDLPELILKKGEDLEKKEGYYN